MPLQMKIVGFEKFKGLSANASKMRERVRSGTLDRMRLLGESIKNRAQTKYLAGRPGLNVVTGRLSSSINYEVSGEGDSLTLRVGTNVVYGKVHEYGMTIRPTSGKFLSWVGPGGKRVFARQVVIPPRPWLRPSIEEEMPMFKRRVEEFLKQVAREGLNANG